MAYTDALKLREMFPDLGTDDEVGPELIASSIAMAQGEVNGHLGRRYALPLPTTCPLLEKIAAELAIYQILTARPFTAPPRPVETAWQARYNAAVAMLIRIGEGEMVITDAAGVVIPQTTVARALSSTQGYVPTFGEGPDQGFIVDRNKIQDELSRRSG